MKVIKERVYQSRSYKWVFIFILILFLICLLFKCCDSSGNNITYLNHKNLIYPDRPEYLTDIDTNNLMVSPNDPLKRRKLDGVINLYLEDSIDVISFCKKVAERDSSNKYMVNFYAEEYNSVQFKVEENEKENFIAYVEKNFDSDVKFILEEWIFDYSSIEFNDELYGEKDNYWFYDFINLPNVWEQEIGSEDITIAVIDDGFDDSHEDLKGKYESSWNVFGYNKNVNFTGGKSHGTHVAGTVSAKSNNGKGISGVAPNCKIMPIQVADNNGVITITSLINGIFYALKNDADVINISLAMRLPSISSLNTFEQDLIAEQYLKTEERLWNEIFRIADSEGVIIVQAAGNDNIKANVDPMKRSEHCIIVGAVDQTGRKANFSNYGNSIDVYAPGVNILSTIPNDKYDLMDGTSMASPIVSGAVALLKSKDKNLNCTKLKSLLEESNFTMGETGIALLNIEELFNAL